MKLNLAVVIRGVRSTTQFTPEGHQNKSVDPAAQNVRSREGWNDEFRLSVGTPNLWHATEGPKVSDVDCDNLLRSKMAEDMAPLDVFSICWVPNSTWVYTIPTEILCGFAQSLLANTIVYRLMVHQQRVT